MTVAQKSLLWREWKLAADWYLAHGKTRADLEGLRHLLVRQAVGSDLSMAAWRRWTNSQVDRVLAKFRAVYDAGNLDAQLGALEQPERRREDLVNRCWDAVRSFIRGHDEAHTVDLCDRYLDGTAKKMFGIHFRDLDADQLRRVMGAMERSARVRAAKAAPATASAPETKENPF